MLRVKFTEDITTLSHELNRVMQESTQANISISLRYNIEHMELDIIINHRNNQIMNKTIILPEMACDLKTYLLQIVEQAIQFGRIYERAYKKLVSEASSEINSVEYEKQVPKFSSFETGACKYPNLGHIRYCYLKLIGHNCNPQWLKIYFRSTGLLLDQTESEIGKSRKKQLSESHMTDAPPNVPILHESLRGCAIEFIKQNQKAIMSKVTSLPLNKSKLREDIVCSNILVMKREGQKLVSCRMGDMANPTSDLYIVMIPSSISSHKKIAAYGKSVGGGGPICLGEAGWPGFEQGMPDVDPASILDDDSRRYRNDAQEYNIIEKLEKLHPGDEYINGIMEALIQEHISG